MFVLQRLTVGQVPRVVPGYLVLSFLSMEKEKTALPCGAYRISQVGRHPQGSQNLREDASSELCCCGLVPLSALHIYQSIDGSEPDDLSHTDSFCCSGIPLLVSGQTRGQEWGEMLLASATLVIK